MAIDTIPPWLNVRPTDFMAAAQEGATAGLRVGELSQQADITRAKLQQEAELQGARLAQESIMQQQRLGMEAQRLQQQAQIAQMELEAKREQSAQQAARIAQQHEMEFAYKQASLGLQQERLAETASQADYKNRVAALSYAHNQGLAKWVAGGGDLAEGMAQYPLANTTFSRTLQATKPPTKDFGEIQTREYGWGTAVWRQGSPGVHVLQKKSGIDEKILMKDLDRVNRELAITTEEDRRSELLREAEATKTALREISARGTTETGTGTGAESTRLQPPDWMTGRNVMPAPLGTTVSDIVTPSDVSATATGTAPPAPAATNVPSAAAEPATPAAPAAPAAPQFKARTQTEADQVLRQAWDKYLRAPSKVNDIRSQLKSMIPKLTDEDLDKMGFK